jgi:glycerol-3-phosphate acyltransferase PlsY
MLAASGSGNPETAEPLPDWINIGANLICIVIAVLVLLPRFRAMGAIAAGVNMIISMVTNVLVDGQAYALMVLPFNIVTLALSVLVAWHHRADLGEGRKS